MPHFHAHILRSCCSTRKIREHWKLSEEERLASLNHALTIKGEREAQVSLMRKAHEEEKSRLVGFRASLHQAGRCSGVPLIQTSFPPAVALQSALPDLFVERECIASLCTR